MICNEFCNGGFFSLRFPCKMIQIVEKNFGPGSKKYTKGLHQGRWERFGPDIRIKKVFAEFGPVRFGNLRTGKRSSSDLDLFYSENFGGYHKKGKAY